MRSKIRLLGIAPYENMRSLMLTVAEEYDNIELTVFVGDLQQGVELARRNFYNDYDAIISRGGTASMLRKLLNLPVIEIAITAYDIMRAMHLAANVSDSYAIVGFPNITASAKQLCQLMQYKIDIYSIHDAGEVEETLLSLRQKGTQAILCDVVAHTTALRLGLDVVLITSSAEDIRAAFDGAIHLYHNYRSLREENHFLRSLIWNQINHTVAFNDQGELFFSTLENNAVPILQYLQEESRAPSRERRHILKQINNVQYSIRMGHETFDGRKYTIFYFSESRAPSAELQRGIRYAGWPEAEEQYRNSLYGIVGMTRELQDFIGQINQSDQPIMVFGEDGTCKEQAVNLIYLQSTRRDCPLVVIDCFLLNEKAWEYLMEHYSSPLTGTGCTIFIKNVDVLTGERRRQLISNMLDMDICKRNRLLFSCVCRKGETATEAGMEFVEKLSCMPLFLPPMRGRSAHIPAIASMYLSYLNTMMAKDIMGLDENASRRMQDFDWPHNYTQFQRIMRELVLKTDGPYITGESVEEILRRERTVATVNTQVEDAGKPLDLSLTLSEINREIIGRVLLEEDGNQSRTAQRLGISRTTLWRLLNNP